MRKAKADPRVAQNMLKKVEAHKEELMQDGPMNRSKPGENGESARKKDNLRLLCLKNRLVYHERKREAEKLPSLCKNKDKPHSERDNTITRATQQL